MQTFLPYADFDSTANVLDDKRLNKQIVECQNILNTLFGYTDGWRKHPVVHMWAGFEESLMGYMELMVVSYNLRRLKKGKERRLHKSYFAVQDYCGVSYMVPFHLQNGALIRSHRSQLLKKDFEHYKQFDWHRGENAVPVGELPYVWPKSPYWSEDYRR